MCLSTSIFKRTQDFSRSAKAFVLYMIVFFQIMAERLRPLAEQFKRGRHTHTQKRESESEIETETERRNLFAWYLAVGDLIMLLPNHLTIRTQALILGGTYRSWSSVS